MRVQGRRVDWGESGYLAPGDYALGPDGNWYGRTPNGHSGGFAEHSVEVHEDGTITVAPSIRVTRPADQTLPEVELWHGYLERGVWRTV